MRALLPTGLRGRLMLGFVFVNPDPGAEPYLRQEAA